MNHDIIVIGGSAGAIEVLMHLAQGLPPRFPGTIFIVIHISATSPGILPQLLSRAGPLPAQHAVHGAPFKKGHIYVAPPDAHFILDKNRMLLTSGPKENGFRPAIDPLFRSAAMAFRDRVVGVLLSGGLDDGNAGLVAIRRFHGTTIVQDPADALVESMPSSAIQAQIPSYILPSTQIAHKLVQLNQPSTSHKESLVASRRTPSRSPPSNGHSVELIDTAIPPPDMPTVQPRNLTCPECGGSMWELDDTPLRFRCHTGHLLTANTMAAQQKNLIENALWSAIRALQESAELRRRMAESLTAGPASSAYNLFHRQAGETQEKADVLRKLLTEGWPYTDTAKIPKTTKRVARKSKKVRSK